MKKLLFIALIITLAASFQSCKDDDDSTTTTTSTTSNPGVSDGITFTSPGSLKISIDHKFNDFILQKGQIEFITDAMDSIKVTQLTYYISNVTLTTANGNEVNLGNYHLVEFTPAKKSEINLSNVPAGNYTAISYMVGVDSAANSTGSHTGDLDPSNGMYWSWSTGYVFFRLKGWYNGQDAYSFDIGGDGNQMKVTHSITPYKVSGTSATANVTFDLARVFNTPNQYDIDADGADIHDSGAPGIAKFRPNISGAFVVSSVQ